MNWAECCEFDKKNRPITSEDITQSGPTCSDCLLLLQGLISGGALKYEYYYSSSCTTVVVQRRSAPNMYVQSFVFAGRIEWRLLESTIHSISINSAECCELDKKNRPIASKDML